MLRRDCGGMPSCALRVPFDGFVAVLELVVSWFIELDSVEGPAATSSYAGGGPSIGAAIVILGVDLLMRSPGCQNKLQMMISSLNQQLDVL
jgi:hypothetical protein